MAEAAPLRRRTTTSRARRARRRWPGRTLAPELRTDGPYARLGVLWVLVTALVVALGAIPLAVWFAVLAGLAAAEAVRTSVHNAPRANARVAVAGAAATAAVLLAVPGWATAIAGLVAAGVLTVLAAVRGRARSAQPPLTDLMRALAGTVLPAAASAGIVLTRHVGTAPVVVVLAYTVVHDASTWIVGAETGGVIEGTVAAVAAMAVVTLVVATVLVPPLQGAEPWVLGAVAIVTAPIGPLVATALLGDRTRRVPALRRLDSLLVLGPAWAVAATIAWR